MAAYAALLSLSKVIDLTLSQEHKYVCLCSRDQMMSLHEDIDRLQDLLEHLSVRSHPSIGVLESRIRDVAYHLEDITEHASMEYGIPYNEDDIPRTEDGIPSIEDDILSKISFSRKFESLFCMPSSPAAETPSPVPKTPSAFDMCAREIGMLLQETIEMKENNTTGACHPSTTTTSSTEVRTAKLDLSEVPVRIKDLIFRSGPKLEIVSITGMGGIGKTSLARAIYEHANMLCHFDICSWVTVSQQFNVQEILRGLLPSKEHEDHTLCVRLIEFVYKRLIGRRFFIVLDDMWDGKAWDCIRNAFADDNKGSRIILTTRSFDVAAYVGSSSPVHEMQFLNYEQSWDLLRKEVGRSALWPKELEDIGRRISRNCRGLPLAIVAMAGILKFNMTEEHWNRVARDTKSGKTASHDHLLSILALSYTNLPPYLKPCFLYFGIFKEDEEIPTTELVRLWSAEGFLKARGSKEMEEIAEEYLEELVARNLVLVKKRRPGGRIKTCSIHDSLRDLSLREAHRDQFSHHISWEGRLPINNGIRRVSIDCGLFTDHELVHYPHARSLRSSEYENMVSVIQHFWLIRVFLGRVRITENSHLSILYQLTNLRYLHIHLDSREDKRPTLTIGESISKLQYLETLIFSGFWETDIRPYTLVLPSAIWEMPRLRHLILVEESKLLCPAPNEMCSSGLQALQTLSKVTNFDLSRSITAKFSNLKKLKLYYVYKSKDYTWFSLTNLVYLRQLEELTITSDIFVELHDLSIPHKLKKLSLENTRMPIEKMSLIGSLPNLEVLKLERDAFEGHVWEPIEGEFGQLKCLKMKNVQLKEWSAEMLIIEMLIIESCKFLNKVPAGIGEICTLQKLVLHDCKAAEASVEEIKAEQESYCNDSLQVIITNWDD